MRLGATQTSHSLARKRMTVAVLIAIAAATMKLASVMTATPATITGIILLVGADESERVVNWYASGQTSQVVQLAKTKDLKQGEFPNNAKTYTAVVAANTVNGGFNGHAILDQLDEKTDYSYRVGGDGAWSPTYAFKTGRSDGDFDFLFFGDPQIGSSGDVALRHAAAKYRIRRLPSIRIRSRRAGPAPPSGPAWRAS